MGGILGGRPIPFFKNFVFFCIIGKIRKLPNPIVDASDSALTHPHTMSTRSTCNGSLQLPQTGSRSKKTCSLCLWGSTATVCARLAASSSRSRSSPDRGAPNPKRSKSERCSSGSVAKRYARGNCHWRGMREGDDGINTHACAHAHAHTHTRTRTHVHTCTRTHGMHTHTRIHACQHVHTRTHSYPDLTSTAPLFGGAVTGSRQHAHARARSWFLLQVFAAEVRIPRGCLPRIVRHRVAIMPQDQLNQAWHADQAVQYYSSSQGLWLDATVLRVHTDGHVTIDIRGRVSEAKIRPRVPVSHTVVVVLSTQWGSVDFLLLPKKESEGGKGRGGGRQNSMNERLLASEHHAPFPVARLA